MESMLIVCFVISVLLVIYAYFGYPALIWALSRTVGRNRKRQALSDAELPHVSILIAAYNEESEIEARIQNLLELNYPAEKCEIVIASDGSSDRTNEIVRRYENRGVRLLDFFPRRGKASVLNDAMGQVSHERSEE